MIRPGCLLAMGLSLGMACGSPRAPSMSSGSGSEADLIPTLAVTIRGDSVILALHVSNGGGAPVVLRYATGQRFDFAVRDGRGAVVWRWSADRVFTAQLGLDTVAAGASRDFRASWAPGTARGNYTAEGRLTATNHPITLKTGLELPGG